MNHDMSRYALENGPDEPRYVRCVNCRGRGGWTVPGAGWTDCLACHGDGEIPADDIEDDR